MLCYAFHYENMLIPVAKTFKRGDYNGAQGLWASIKALGIATGYYIAITAFVGLIVKRSEEVPSHNYDLCFAVFHNF